jgi:hypothetical protein
MGREMTIPWFSLRSSSTPTSRVTLREQAPTKSWGDGVVHMHQNNRGDAVVGIEKAKGGVGGKILNQ